MVVVGQVWLAFGRRVLPTAHTSKRLFVKNGQSFFQPVKVVEHNVQIGDLLEEAIPRHLEVGEVFLGVIGHMPVEPTLEQVAEILRKRKNLEGAEIFGHQSAPFTERQKSIVSRGRWLGELTKDFLSRGKDEVEGHGLPK